MREIKFIQRKIKFRAWDGEQMLQGSKYVALVRENSWSFEEANEYDDYCGFGTRAKVLMQYTGLTDKNGKEIYEGDVVQVYHLPSNVPEHPEWDWIECFKYTADMTNGDCYKWTQTEKTRVVIGNIYENPELI